MCSNFHKMPNNAATFMNRHRHPGTSGLTLLETVIASSILVLLVSALAITMTQINRWAAAARLHTLALAVAQQKVDEVLTTKWLVLSPRPAVLAAGTVTEANLSLNDDTHNNQAGLSSVFTGLDAPVQATRTTQVTDLPPRGVRAAVTVSFTYRNHTYQTQLTTIRVTDDI